MEGLAIGRIVHYAQAADSGERPAIITKVWHGGGLVNLVVFRDGTLDRVVILLGWPVPVFGGRLRDGCSLREDTEHAYLIYGAEEVVKVFPASVTMREIEVVMNEDADARLHKAARLQA